MAFLNRSKPDARMTATQVAAATASPLPVAPVAAASGGTPTAAAADPAAETRPQLRAVPASPEPQMAPPPDDVESVIGNDLAIEGQSITIRCKGSLRVNGHIQANLHSRRLVVGEEARIAGSIIAEDIAVFGKVTGSISGNVVRLQPTSVVDGDIHARSLAIESGARFEGRSRWVQNPAEITPQIEATRIEAPVMDAPAMAAPVMAAPVMAAPVTAAPVMAGALDESPPIGRLPLPVSAIPGASYAPSPAPQRPEDVRGAGAARAYFAPDAHVAG